MRGAASRYGLSVECYATLAVNDIAAVVTYEPYSGVVRQDPALTYLQLNPTASANCSHSLDWIPILGDFISGWIERPEGVAVAFSFGADRVRCFT